MIKQYKCDVAIVGGGPVGLTLAMLLASYDREVMVLESREHGEPPSVKCNHVSARSMEIFRRLGIAESVRNSGLPADYPNDISFRTTFVGKELSRIPIPGRAERYTATGGPDTWWPTPEPPHRINQIFLEPVLFEKAWADPKICILNRVAYQSFEQDEKSVTIMAEDLECGETFSVTADYLVGCDGGRSAVRKQIGAKLTGDSIVTRVQSSYIQAPELKALQKTNSAWSTMVLNSRRSGTVYAIDGRETWLVHNYLKEDEPDFDSVDRDWAIRAILGIDQEVKYRVLNKEDWFGRRLVANKFRQGRTFICGDAAHIWVPFAGYGMNAGLADAENLAWLLAAVLNGWASENIIEAHEAERLSITEQVSYFAMDHAQETAKQRRTVPDDVEEDSVAGEAARAQVGERAYKLNVQQYCCGGLNFGYYYAHSPIILYDGEQQPAYGMADFIQSTVPGCRTPHIWLSDGRSLYDAAGSGYTLLRFDPAVNVRPLTEAAARHGVPFEVLDVSSDEADKFYHHRLVVSRPDQHVAWRGNKLPADVGALIDTLRGVG